MSKLKAYAATISGSFEDGKGEIVDFMDVKGVLPFTDSEELANAAIRNRYAQMWLGADKRYPGRIARVRECYIDSLEETTAEFSYVGKNITDMTYEELQDLAVAKDLRGVPLYKAGALRESQGRAYAEFGNKVLGMDVDHRKEGFNVMKLPPLVVDGSTRKDKQKKLTNDEVIAQEQASTSTEKPTFTRAELEKLAKENGITFNPAITDENLQKKIFAGNEGADAK